MLCFVDCRKYKISLRQFPPYGTVNSQFGSEHSTYEEALALMVLLLLTVENTKHCPEKILPWDPSAAWREVVFMCIVYVLFFYMSGR